MGRGMPHRSANWEWESSMESIKTFRRVATVPSVIAFIGALFPSTNVINKTQTANYIPKIMNSKMQNTSICNPYSIISYWESEIKVMRQKNFIIH